jgi:hypothetical protein
MKTALIILIIIALIFIVIVIKASKFRRSNGYGRIYKQAYIMPKND